MASSTLTYEDKVRATHNWHEFSGAVTAGPMWPTITLEDVRQFLLAYLGRERTLIGNGRVIAAAFIGAMTHKSGITEEAMGRLAVATMHGCEPVRFSYILSTLRGEGDRPALRGHIYLLCPDEWLAPVGESPYLSKQQREANELDIQRFHDARDLRNFQCFGLEKKLDSRLNEAFLTKLVASFLSRKVVLKPSAV